MYINGLNGHADAVELADEQEDDGTPKVGDTCVVTENHVGTDDGMLSLEKGQMLTISHLDDSGWSGATVLHEIPSSWFMRKKFLS